MKCGLQVTAWVHNQPAPLVCIPDLTILEALAVSDSWHTWAIAVPEGAIQIELHCDTDRDGNCRLHSYSMISDNWIGSNASNIEMLLVFDGDQEQRSCLRRASLSQSWTFYGFSE